MSQARTKLLQITPTLHVGGLEQVVVTLCRNIDRERFDPYVLCLRDRGPLAAMLEDEGVPVLTVHSRPMEGADYFGFRLVARLVRSHGFEVVHTHNTPSLIFGGFGALLGGARRIIHTDHARLYPEKRRLVIAERLMAHWTDWVVGVSQETTDQLHRHVGIPRRQLLTIPNGIDGDRYSVTVDRTAKLHSLGVPSDRTLILGMCARLTAQKGIRYMLEAMPAIVAHRSDVMLLVVGDGSLRDELEKMAETLGITSHVLFLGSRDDVPELLSVFDVFVLPSIWEGLPMALLEAMAAGKAIVASDVGGVSTAIAHKRSGFLIPPRSAEAIASSIQALASSADLRERLAREARAAFTDGFSSARMTRRYERLYLGKPPPTA